MGRVCNCLLSICKSIQLLLSLVLLAAGAFITYKTVAQSGTAHQLESSLRNLKDPNTRLQLEQSLGANFTNIGVTEDEVTETIDMLAGSLAPALNVFKELPLRSIVVSAAGLWSIISIIISSCVCSKQSSKKTKKRLLCITLEIATLIVLIAGTISASLLAISYGPVILHGTLIQDSLAKVEAIVAAVVKGISNNPQTPQHTDDMLSDLLQIGAVAIGAFGAALICTTISSLSLLTACCVHHSSSNPDRRRHVLTDLERARNEAVFLPDYGRHETFMNKHTPARSVIEEVELSNHLARNNRLFVDPVSGAVISPPPRYFRRNHGYERL